MEKPPLHDLWAHSFTLCDPTLSILINANAMDDSAVLANTRMSDAGPYLEYRVEITPGSREEVLTVLRDAIAILERLPESGTIEAICELMGTDFSELKA